MPFPIVMPEELKSVTDSLNVMVIGMDDAFVGDDSVEVTATVGDVVS